MTKIKDVKQKIIDAVYSIDMNKLSLTELKTVAEIANDISKITENTIDAVDTMMKIYGGYGGKNKLLSELKEEK